MCAEATNAPSPASPADRVPPSNLAAERSVLGSVLIDDKSLSVVMDQLREDAFYTPAHRLIFRAVRQLFDNRQAVDLVTLTNALQSQGTLEQSGGAAYLTELSDAVPTTANIDHYVKIVVDKWLTRELIRTTREVYEDCFSTEVETEDLFESAEQRIFRIAQMRSRQDFMDLKDMILPVFDELEKLSKKGGIVTGVGTGFNRLNELTTGLHGSELIIIAARPSMGKTAFALNVAEHVALEENKAVAIFSLEMSAKQLVMRLLASRGRVDGQHLRRGDLSNPDWAGLMQAASILKKANIYIDASPQLTPLEIRARCRRLKSENPNLALVVVDYIQLMDARGIGREIDSREKEIAYISRSLKHMAIELDLPVIALSQLNREAERGRGDKPARPQLSQLRESGAIEQDADVVILLYRPSYYFKDPKYADRADIILAKQRNGPTGTVVLQFLDRFARFQDPPQGYMDQFADEDL
ncbi:replicative DNA helicase [bacterium]|nr:replicative DNA helicase [bacterium]